MPAARGGSSTICAGVLPSAVTRCRLGTMAPLHRPSPSGARAWIRELSGLLMPVQCCGCGRWDEVVCAQCREDLSAPPQWRTIDGCEGEPVGLWAIGAYEGTLRRLVLAAKHDPRVDLAQLAGLVGAALGNGLAMDLRWGTREAVVVPMPSPRGRERTGRLPALVTAHALASSLAAAPTGPSTASVRSCLRLRRSSRGQAGRSGAQRRAGRAGTMRVGEPGVVGPAVPYVLVDDVVTTGATVREAQRVLGGTPVAVAAWADVR